MNIPQSHYTLESFLEYIVKNSTEVFGKGELRWLKGYLLYVDVRWENILSSLEPLKMGDIYKIKFKTGTENVNFYAHEWEPGMLMIFTSSTQDIYDLTLRNFIENQRGISQTWIKPSVLDNLKNYLISIYGARVYRFIAKRHKHWKYPSRIRPEEERRISYSGKDANETLKEVQNLYGVIPSSIDLQIDEYKLQINRNGLFVIRQINLRTIGILRELVDQVIAKQIILKTTSQKFNVETRAITFGNKKFNIPQVAAGKIILPHIRLSELMIRHMFGKYGPDENSDNTIEVSGTSFESDEDIENDFSFIDAYVSESPLIFNATVVDEVKGTVFGISGVENEIALIPKHRTSFESFIKFFSVIAENFDEGAELTTFSEAIHA